MSKTSRLKGITPKKVINYIKRRTHKAYINRLQKNLSDMPISPNKIAIMTNTSAYTCNPKYIYEELRHSYPEYDIVWLVESNRTDTKDYPKDAHIESIATVSGLKEVFSARLWLDNGVVFSNYFDKRPGQLHIQTMHGSLGIKKLDNAILSRNARGESGRLVVRRESENTDYVITNSLFEEEVFRTVFWKNTPMLRLGHARTDILFNTNEHIINQIRTNLNSRYDIPTDKSLVLYAPTHRRGMSAKDIDIEYDRLIQALGDRFDEDFVVLIRMHPRTKDLSPHITEDYKQIVYDVTDYPDIQELMLVTKVGITDYSSWIYDYVNTGRPGFIYARDLDRYDINTGFAYSIYSTPFPVCTSNEELLKAIESFDSTSFTAKCKEFLDEKQAVDDGKSAKRIADWIHEIINSQNKK